MSPSIANAQSEMLNSSLPLLLSNTTPLGVSQTVFLPYFSESEGFQSTLILNNNAVHSVTVTVDLFDEFGHSVRKQIVMVPHAVREMPVSDLMGPKDEQLREGHVELYYSGRPREVTAQIDINDPLSRVVLQSLRAERADFSSSPTRGACVDSRLG
jgi:hypothetical protein